MTKICISCKIEKDIVQFHKNSTGGYRSICKKCRCAYQKKYREEKPYIINDWRKNNRELINKTHREWIKENKENHYSNKKKSHTRLYKTNFAYKIWYCLKRRIYIALDGISTCDNMRNLIGCDREFIVKYLKSQFTPGMSVDNYGVGSGCWNIDHIKPCSSFDFIKRSSQRECFHFTNLQPLWVEENTCKGNKNNENYSLI